MGHRVLVPLDRVAERGELGVVEKVSNRLDRGDRQVAGLGLGEEVSLAVVTAELGQDAGLVGAAALILRGDAYWSA